jgi:hypothetical protein
MTAFGHHLLKNLGVAALLRMKGMNSPLAEGCQSLHTFSDFEKAVFISNAALEKN